MPRLAPVTRAVRPASFICVLFRGQCFGRSHLAPLGGWGKSARATTRMRPLSSPFSLHLMVTPTRLRLLWRAPPIVHKLSRKAQSGAPVHVRGVDGSRRPPRPAGILAAWRFTGERTHPSLAFFSAITIKVDRTSGSGRRWRPDHRPNPDAHIDQL